MCSMKRSPQCRGLRGFDLPVHTRNETISIPDLPYPFPLPKPYLSMMCEVLVRKHPLYAAVQILLCCPGR